jgi:hypothetical protein
MLARVCPPPGSVRASLARAQVLAGGARERDALDAGSFMKSLCGSHDCLLFILCLGLATLFAPGAADPRPQSTHIELQNQCWAMQLNVSVLAIRRGWLNVRDATDCARAR